MLPGTYSDSVISVKSNQWVVSTDGPYATLFTLGFSTVFSLGSAAGISNVTVKGFGFMNQIPPTNIIAFVQKTISATIEDCVFSNLTVSSSAVRTATIRVGINSDVIIRNCIFEDLNGIDSFGNIRGISAILLNSNPTIARIDNCRFSNIIGYTTTTGLPLGAGAIWVSHVGSTAIITNSKFIGNSLSINNAATLTTGGSVNATSNSFYTLPSPHKTFSCATGMILFNAGSNNYCGTTSHDVACGLGVPNFSPVDACGICGGDDSNMNCAGKCFKNATCPDPVTIYVAPSALGNGNGSSPENAMGSISSAISTSSFGDVIQLLNGTYPGGNNWGGKSITIQGNSSNPNCVVIDCGGSGTAFQASTGENLFANLNSMKIRNCSRALLASNYSSASLDNLIIEYTTNVPVSFGGNGRVFNTIFRSNINAAGGIINAGGSGVWSVNVTDCKFYNNLASKGVFGSVNTYSFLTGNVLVNNSLTGGSYGGFHFDSGAYATLSLNSFSNTGLFANVAGSSIYCQAGVILDPDNVFCNGGTNPISCPSISSTTAGSFLDSCSVCNG